jgi:hypothetical protein
MAPKNTRTSCSKEPICKLSKIVLETPYNAITT